jgi:hypothetical protein
MKARREVSRGCRIAFIEPAVGAVEQEAEFFV